MPWYRAGTINVSNGSKNITGINTTWGSGTITNGDSFCLVDSNNNAIEPFYEIEEITDNTHLILKNNYSGLTVENTNYAIWNLAGEHTTAYLSAQVAKMLNDSAQSSVTTNLEAITKAATQAVTAANTATAQATAASQSAESAAQSALTAAEGVPDASSTVKGKVSLATQEELNLGSTTNKVVTTTTLTANKNIAGGLVGLNSDCFVPIQYLQLAGIPVVLDNTISTLTIDNTYNNKRIIFTNPNECNVVLPVDGLTNSFNCLIRNNSGGTLSITALTGATIENTETTWTDASKYVSVLLDIVSPSYVYYLVGSLE